MRSFGVANAVMRGPKRGTNVTPGSSATEAMMRASWLGVILSAVLLLAGAARADDPAPSPTEWQAVIAGQIQAFRTHDAPGALSFAGDEFKKQFTDPEEFVRMIVANGYGPIVESRSQTFGEFKLVEPDQVVQEVKLTGTDQ